MAVLSELVAPFSGICAQLPTINSTHLFVRAPLAEDLHLCCPALCWVKTEAVFCMLQTEYLGARVIGAALCIFRRVLSNFRSSSDIRVFLTHGHTRICTAIQKGLEGKFFVPFLIAKS
jgi:hypothetical protein